MTADDLKMLMQLPVLVSVLFIIYKIQGQFLTSIKEMGQKVDEAIREQARANVIIAEKMGKMDSNINTVADGIVQLNHQLTHSTSLIHEARQEIAKLSKD